MCRFYFKRIPTEEIYKLKYDKNHEVYNKFRFDHFNYFSIIYNNIDHGVYEVYASQKMQKKRVCEVGIYIYRELRNNLPISCFYSMIFRPLNYFSHVILCVTDKDAPRLKRILRFLDKIIKNKKMILKIYQVNYKTFIFTRLLGKL